MRIDIVNTRTNNTITLESYVYNNGILITYFNPGKIEGIFNKVKGVGQNGSSLLSTTLEDRTPIELEGIILAEDKTELNALKRNIDNILNPLDTLIIKYYDGEITKQIECSSAATPLYSTDYKTNNDIALAFSINFECFKPFWMDQEETILNVETWEGGFEFEFQLTTDGIEFAKKGHNEIEIINDGNIEAPIEIFFKGPALNPSITLNNDKFIKVNKHIQESEILYIRTTFGNKAVQVIKESSIEQAYHYIDLNSTFFNLETGLSKISYATEGDFLPQSVVIKYRKHYFSL